MPTLPTNHRTVIDKYRYIILNHTVEQRQSIILLRVPLMSSLQAAHCLKYLYNIDLKAGLYINTMLVGADGEKIRMKVKWKIFGEFYTRKRPNIWKIVQVT